MLKNQLKVLIGLVMMQTACVANADLPEIKPTANDLKESMQRVEAARKKREFKQWKRLQLESQRNPNSYTRKTTKSLVKF